MRIETWARVSAVFEAALAVPRAARPRFLEESCAGDRDVRAEVERLLGLDDCAGETFEPAGVLRAAVWSPGPGTRVGPYTIVRAIASGGMGTVYEAVQDRPRRTVALKMLRLGVASPERLLRFRLEAEVLGRLRHPAIAQIHEAGTHAAGAAQIPYLAMELVADARDIATYAREAALSTEARVRLFLEVLDAVHHGHQKGVIHRDLKAENILVDAEGRPKLIDFGVARASAPFERSDLATRAGEFLGTLATMSPEQLAGDPAEIDARTDVYALGAVLYDLAANRPPYDLSGLSLEQAVRRVREAVPPRAAGVPLELHRILAHALEKDPARRYPSVLALSDDLRRFLAGEAISVGPPTLRYRLQKLAARHRVLLASTAAVIAALALGLVRAQHSANAEARARVDAQREARMASGVSGTLERLLTSLAPQSEGRGVLVEDVLAEAARILPSLDAADPPVGAALHRMVGVSYLALHRTAEAEKHLGAARAYATEHLSPDDPLALEIAASWASLLLDQRHAAESVALARRALAPATLAWGPSERRTCGLRQTLAAGLLAVNDLDGAESVALENLRCFAPGAARDERALSSLLLLANIGVRRAGAADVALARERVEEALAICARTLPPGHFHALEAQQLSGMVAVLEGSARAMPGGPFLPASAGRADLEGSDCVKLAALAEQGMALAAQGDHEPAYRAFSEARELGDRLFGAESLVGIQMRNCVASVCADLGRGDDAVRWAEEAHALAVRVLAPSHPEALRVRATLAQAWTAAGRPETAERLFGELLPEAEQVFGPAHPFVLDVLQARAEALAAAGDRAGTAPDGASGTETARE